MSTSRFFRAGLVASASLTTFALMATSAQAQSRYGNVYDYESGQNCGQACVPAAQMAAPAVSSRYGAPAVTTPAYNPAPVYVDCAQMGTCAPAPSVVYTQPAPAPTYQAAPAYVTPSYAAPVQSYETYAQAAPVNCPAGTTAQSDGTCMQTGSSYSSSGSSYSASGSSYSSGSTYTSDSTYSTGTSAAYGGTVDCPAGTTAQSDGTCMQTGSSYSAPTTSYSAPAATTYSDSTSYGYSAPAAMPVNCPAGTTAQSDGTCMQGGSAPSYAGSSVEIYTGDASSQPATSGAYGYSNDGSYGPSDYLPVRK